MSSQRPSPAVGAKRTIALKRVDGEPLTRVDIQYDVLSTIFHDTHAVFTDPYPSDDTPTAKITFHDLYLKTILQSPKATKALKDKMADSPAFAEDFAMLALLVNVGRVNTTMSCKSYLTLNCHRFSYLYAPVFPEMKTAIRTYHPIPALQKTTGNLQDAPRIKHILKSSLLEDEQTSTPTTPADILTHVVSFKFVPDLYNLPFRKHPFHVDKWANSINNSYESHICSCQPFSGAYIYTLFTKRRV
jgi:Ino eighty subunit 1